MPIAARRRAFLLGRGIVRSVLGAYLGVPPGQVQIAVGPHGKPLLAAADAPAFNVSHSRGLVAIAVTAGFPVGVDLEAVDPSLDVLAIARRFLGVQEAARIARLAPADRAQEFLRLWTRREASAKASGSGFAGGLGATLAAGEDRLLTLVDLDPAPGFVAALAYAAPPAAVHIPDHASACL
jgi:4'-phosphopantetheinyl transferase